MNSRTAAIVLWSAGVVAFSVGAVTAVQSLQAVRAARTQVQSKLNALGELEILESDLARYIAAERAFTALARRPDQLSELIGRLAPGQKPDNIRDGGTEELGEWTLLKKEVVFEDVRLAGVMDLVAELERQRPPWRLTKCVVRSSAKQEGDGQAVLTFAALERTAK